MKMTTIEKRMLIGFGIVSLLVAVAILVYLFSGSVSKQPTKEMQKVSQTESSTKAMTLAESSEAILKFVEAHKPEVTIAVWVIGIIVVFLLLFITNGGKGFLLGLAVIGLIGFIVLKCIDVANGWGDERVIRTIEARLGDMPIEVSSWGFTEIYFPPGWDLENTLSGEGGEGAPRRYTLVLKKNGVRKLFRPEDKEILGLPEGRHPLEVKILLPPGDGGKINSTLTLTTKRSG